VRTLDTNVIVRLLVGDDPRQTPIAEQAFLEAIASGGVYLPDVVLAEVAWVLRGYGLERQVRHDCWSGWCAPAAWWSTTSTA
jgi:predicted nucleic-acid-binding protein